MRRHLVAVLLATTALFGCGALDDLEGVGTSTTDAPDTTESGPTTEAPPTEESPVTGPPAVLPPGDWAEAPLTLELIAEVPGAIAVAPRSGSLDLYVAERAGRVWRVERQVDEKAWTETWKLANRPVLDLRDEVSTDGERGLLGIVFSSDGRALYLSYTDAAGESVLEAVDMGTSGADMSTRRELLRVPQPFANHNGGHVAIGPDGFLYWSLGDGGGGGDPLDTGQDPSDLFGSVLRIDPFPQGDRPYGIPAGNPFAGPDAGGAPEVWLWGARNPWRFSFDRRTGDLWVADVGQNRWEEINLLTTAQHQRGAGANLGWNEMEGFETFDGGTEPADHDPPIFVYGREEGRCSITGGHVYRGSLLTALDGVYVYGDLCTGEIRGLQVTDEGMAEGPLTARAEPGTLVSFGEDAAGELYVLELTGRLSRLTVASDSD